MSQTIIMMQRIAGLFTCSRRNASGTRVEIKKASGLGANTGIKGGKSLGFGSSESTDVDSDPPAVCTSGSDTETSPKTTSSQNLWNMKLPPGLEIPVDGQSSHKNTGATTKVRVPNAEVKPFVPKSVSKAHNVAECLREISASENDIPASLEEVLKRRRERERSAPPKVGLPPDLVNVLNKLTPEQAAVVKAAFEAQSCKTAQPNAPQGPRVENKLRSNIRKLASIDSKRVFMVRKISKLGLDSPEILKTYFSKFGRVENVLVSHSIDKRSVESEDARTGPRFWPAGVGFIVMENADDVVNVFKHGLEHVVSDVCISLTAYEHHNPDDRMRSERNPGLIPSSDQAPKPNKPRFPSYANITEENTFRANLRKLAQIDANRVFMVKKITKLGLGSAQLLRTHFGQFGGVTNVFVTHSIDRRQVDQENPSSKPRVKPGGIGFVVMDKAEDVEAIVHTGSDHTVYGVNINLATYEHHVPEEFASHDDGQSCSH